jgi:hypothetical protein
MHESDAALASIVDALRVVIIEALGALRHLKGLRDLAMDDADAARLAKGIECVARAGDAAARVFGTARRIQRDLEMS